MERSEKRPSILMVFTGGTISMRAVPGRGVVPARGGSEILSLVPELAGLADVRVVDFDRLPGPHWTPERMLELSRLLDRELQAGDFQGAVVTHGTDTLEETATLLDLTLRTNVPVVVTGAMRTPDDPSWDGPANLLDSVRCAASSAARDLGVLAVFGGVIHAARRVVKKHAEAFDAFSSPHGGPLGTVDADGVRLQATPGRRERIPIDRIESRVELIAAAAGVDGRLLLHAVESGARGIVVQALGRGNVPPAMLAAVRVAIGAGIPVVVASRCAEGGTAPVYGYDGGGFTLREAGAVFAGDLPASKARIELMVLLGAGRDASGILRAFEGAGPSFVP